MSRDDNAGPILTVVLIIAVWVALWLLMVYGPRSVHGGELPDVIVREDTVYMPLITPATRERERLDSIFLEKSRADLQKMRRISKKWNYHD